MRDVHELREGSMVDSGIAVRDDVRWMAHWRIEKYDTPDGESIDGLTPYEVIEREGNLLLYGGASALWHRVTGGSTVTAFDNTNANIGVGDSTTAAAATQTDLQAATNKLRKAMDATYPSHTDGTTSGSATVTFRSTFGTSDANFAWQEWGVFNASSTGRMLNRKVESLGTKTSSATWVFTVSLTLA